MRIGILSDTHNRIERTTLAVKLLVEQGAEVLIHCGDLTSPAVVEQCAPLPCYFVFGNNDFDEYELKAAMRRSGGTCLERGGEIILADRKIAVTHGDLNREVRRLTELEPAYFFYGHSHLKADERLGPTRFINPGALHRAPSWTVATLDLETDNLTFHNVHDPIL